ncbi:MAG: hypothetical protein WA702_04690 [Bradyrhizobium sp.]|jgi:hypothetical protein|uniref:hypothetical protein n=1 Tax=Bradyrhizobium sp. TaxID=376 RepID=UPI003C7C0F60
MRGLTARTVRDGIVVQRHRTLVPTLVLIVLAIMIVRDIVIRRWSGPSRPSDVTSRSC